MIMINYENRKPQLVKFFHKEEAKRKPGYIGKMYGWSVKKDGWYGYREIYDGKMRKGVFSKTGNVIITLNDQVSEADNTWRDMFKEAFIQNGRIIFEIRDFHDRAKDVYEMNSILKKEKIQQECSYFVHDLLDYEDDCSFEGRFTKMKLSRRNAGWASACAIPVDRPVITDDIEEAKKFYREIVALGGEGIVGINMASRYSWGERNPDLLKMKAETKIKNCEIIKRVPGLGNGALLIRFPSGIEGTVAGISNEQNERWTTENLRGKLVDISCMQITPSGKPREPRLWGCKL